MIPTHPRVTAVEVVPPYGLKLAFPSMRGHGNMFAPMQDPDYFALVRVDPESGTIVWPNDIDVDPDVLYELAHGSDIPT